MYNHEGFEFRVGGFTLRGTAGGALSVIAQPGTPLAPEQALLLARVLQAVAAPMPALAQWDAAALTALDRLMGGNAPTRAALPQSAPATVPTARVSSSLPEDPATTASPQPAAETNEEAAVQEPQRPPQRRILAFQRNFVPRTPQEAAIALAAAQLDGTHDELDAETVKRLVRPSGDSAALLPSDARVSRRLREAAPLPDRRGAEPQERRPLARDAAHADALLQSYKAPKPEKRLVYPIGPVEAAALLPSAAKPLGKRLVRPSAARVDLSRTGRVESKPLSIATKAPPPAAPAKPAATQAPVVQPARTATPAATPVRTPASPPKPTGTPTAGVGQASAPATAPAAPSRRPAQPLALSGAKPVPVLRASAPPAKPKGGIMDRYDEWMRENPGQHTREHLVDVGLRQGWLPKDDAHRVFNVAMHQQRAREMFMIMRDGSTETFMRREEATRPTSTGPGKIIRRSAAEVAARRQDAP